MELNPFRNMHREDRDQKYDNHWHRGDRHEAPKRTSNPPMISTQIVAQPNKSGNGIPMACNMDIKCWARGRVSRSRFGRSQIRGSAYQLPGTGSGEMATLEKKALLSS